jgi:5-methylcytosine-specific restriction endonuclease McrA
VSTNTERRYYTKRWKDTRLIVLRRDAYRCWVDNCPEYANQCDHIEAASPSLPDTQFYALTNLRASCRKHNTARGISAMLDRDTAGGVKEPPRSFSYGGSRLRPRCY